MEIPQKVHGNLRLQSIDVLRGLIMIIMAIDHVRVYSGIPAGGPTAGIFFTRWITHFCAPLFVFFAGTSAFLYFQKTRDRQELMKFLLTRGVLLVVLELTVIKFGWMFNFDYGFTFTGVIWMLGWCMILLSFFVRLQPVTLAVTGVVIISAQQIFQYVPSLFPEGIQDPVAKIWGFFYPVAAKSNANILSGTSGVSPTFGLSIFYVIIPWIGVMMAGYGFGQLIILRDQVKRNKWLLTIGLSAIALFILAGTAVTVYNTSSEDARPFLFRLLGQQKYPPSQLYLLMTLGPIIALIPWAEKAKGKIIDILRTIGRVPMFFYIVHIPLIHVTAFVVNLILSGNIHQDYYHTAPFVHMDEEQWWGLPLLYATWIFDVVLLWFLCQWYARYKDEHPDKKWLKFL